MTAVLQERAAKQEETEAENKKAEEMTAKKSSKGKKPSQPSQRKAKAKEGPKEAQEAVVKEMPVNKNIEKMAEFVPSPLHHASSLSSNKSELEDAPVMEQKTSSRSVLKMSNEEGERIKKKS